ncbi:MAG: hypothetical protein E7478_02065 [Ruminococcaceae bacterium]|nr:hypothetical protein [Oscillospiraceae bacterium]
MEHTTNYSVIEQKCRTEELGEYITYGIQAVCCGESQLISDITTDKAQAESMAECFNKNRLSLIHFPEVVEDMMY